LGIDQWEVDGAEGERVPRERGRFQVDAGGVPVMAVAVTARPHRTYIIGYYQRIIAISVGLVYGILSLIFGLRQSGLHLLFGLFDAAFQGLLPPRQTCLVIPDVILHPLKRRLVLDVCRRPGVGFTGRWGLRPHKDLGIGVGRRFLIGDVPDAVVTHPAVDIGPGLRISKAGRQQADGIDHPSHLESPFIRADESAKGIAGPETAREQHNALYPKLSIPSTAGNDGSRNRVL
jgi:hypothetical protein